MLTVTGWEEGSTVTNGRAGESVQSIPPMDEERELEHMHGKGKHNCSVADSKHRSLSERRS